MILEALLVHPLTLSLGWTLLHSLWQGLVIAGVLGVALLVLEHQKSQARHALATVLLLIWLAAPVITFLGIAPTSSDTSPSLATANTLLSPAVTEGNGSEAETTAVASLAGKRPIFGSRTGLAAPTLSELRGLLPYAALAWLAIAGLLSLRLLGGIVLVERLARSGVALTDLQSRLDALATQLGLHRNVRLRASELVDSPSALGWLRPVVLLPISALSGLTAAQLELILAHELAHIRRHDYLTSILQGVAEALLFYHPLTWWLSGVIRCEREHSCDELALRATGSGRLELAEALAQLETVRPTPTPALTATGNLTRRIRRLLGRPQDRPQLTLVTTVLAGALVATIALTTLAQEPPGIREIAEQLESNLTSEEIEVADRPVIVIDPAHSHLLPGADGPIAEADLTLAIAHKVRELLEQQGIVVLLTREGGHGLADTPQEDLAARAALATPERQAFISLHAGFTTETATQGIATFIATPRRNTEDERSRYQDSRDLAEALQNHLVAATGAPDRGVRNNNLAPIRLAQSPAASVDLGFLSNPNEAANLATREYQEQLALGLAEGIVAYLGGTVSGVPTADNNGIDPRVDPVVPSITVGDVPLHATLPESAPSDRIRQWATVEGDVEFKPHYSGVEVIRGNGRITIEERTPTRSRRVIVSAVSEGLHHSYSEDGRTAPFDEGAIAWYERLLEELVLEPLRQRPPAALRDSRDHHDEEKYQSLILLQGGFDYLVRLLRPPEADADSTYLVPIYEKLAHASAHGLIDQQLLVSALSHYLSTFELDRGEVASLLYAIRHVDSEAARRELYDELRQKGTRIGAAPSLLDENLHATFLAEWERAQSRVAEPESTAPLPQEIGQRTYHIQEVPADEDADFAMATVVLPDDREYFIEEAPLPHLGESGTPRPTTSRLAGN